MRKMSRQYKVNSFLVANESNHLLGIVTYRDIVFEDGKKKISEVMTPREKLVTAKPGISIEEAKEILKAHKEILRALTIVRYDSLDATLRSLLTITSSTTISLPLIHS